MLLQTPSPLQPTPTYPCHTTMSAALRIQPGVNRNRPRVRAPPPYRLKYAKNVIESTSFRNEMSALVAQHPQPPSATGPFQFQINGTQTSFLLSDLQKDQVGCCSPLLPAKPRQALPRPATLCQGTHRVDDRNLTPFLLSSPPCACCLAGPYRPTGRTDPLGELHSPRRKRKRR